MAQANYVTNANRELITDASPNRPLQRTERFRQASSAPWKLWQHGGPHE